MAREEIDVSAERVCGYGYFVVASLAATLPLLEPFV
jgi:hypothetical protein